MKEVILMIIPSFTAGKRLRNNKSHLKAGFTSPMAILRY
jgi:hypothetical protein